MGSMSATHLGLGPAAQRALFDIGVTPGDAAAEAATLSDGRNPVGRQKRLAGGFPPAFLFRSFAARRDRIGHRRTGYEILLPL